MTFDFATGAGCVVTTTASEPWLTNVSASGGRVSYDVAQSTGAERTGTVVVSTPDTGSSATFTVSQASGCVVTLPASAGTMAQGGGASSFAVTSGTGCGWTATSSDPWISGLASTPTGVAYRAAENGAIARSATIVVTSTSTASKVTFTLQQDGAIVQPVITTQPRSIEVDEGQPFEVGVSASGGSLFYTWRRDGKVVEGLQGPLFKTSAATTDQDGTYDVVVSNAAGEVTSAPFTVTVRPTNPANGYGVGASGGWGCGVRSTGTRSGTALFIGVFALLGCLRRRRSSAK